MRVFQKKPPNSKTTKTHPGATRHQKKRQHWTSPLYLPMRCAEGAKPRRTNHQVKTTHQNTTHKQPSHQRNKRQTQPKAQQTAQPTNKTNQKTANKPTRPTPTATSAARRGRRCFPVSGGSFCRECCAAGTRKFWLGSVRLVPYVYVENSHLEAGGVPSTTGLWFLTLRIISDLGESQNRIGPQEWWVSFWLPINFEGRQQNPRLFLTLRIVTWGQGGTFHDRMLVPYFEN